MWIMEQPVINLNPVFHSALPAMHKINGGARHKKNPTDCS